mgnify:CR=1 FL=1
MKTDDPSEDNIQTNQTDNFLSDQDVFASKQQNSKLSKKARGVKKKAFQ